MTKRQNSLVFVAIYHTFYINSNNWQSGFKEIGIVLYGTVCVCQGNILSAKGLEDGLL